MEMESSDLVSVANNAEEIIPQIFSFLQAAEASIEEMIVSNGVRQSLDKDSIASCKAFLIGHMKDAISRLNLPDLLEFIRNDPNIMASELLKMLENENGHLLTLSKNQTNSSKDAAQEIQNLKSKIEMMDAIQNGLNNRKTVDNDLLREEIDQLKDLNKHLKKDFDAICTKCCPELKDDIKRIFSALEAAQSCSDEEDRWLDLTSLNFQMESLNLLLACDILEFDHEGMRIKFAPID